MQRASDAKIAYLNGLVEIQSRIATLQIDYIRKQLTGQDFARALAKYHAALADHVGQPPSSPGLSDQFQETEAREEWTRGRASRSARV